MDKEVYTLYKDFEQTHWWFRARANILKGQISLLSLPKRPSILNVGAAMGGSTIWLQHFGSVISLEKDKECCEYMEKELGLEVVENSICETGLPDNYFDLICAFDVVEHVKNDRQAIAEMLRCCKPGGYIMVAVPAYDFLWSSHDEKVHHHRRYTLKMLKKLITEHPTLEIVYQTYFNTFLFLPIAFYRLLENLMAKAKLFMPRGTTQLSQSKWQKPLYHIFNIEHHLLDRRYRLPFGVSALLVVRKKQVNL